MEKVESNFVKGKSIYVGIDVHKKDWTVHIVCEGEVLYHGTISPDAERLVQLIKRHKAKSVHTVYEAGFSGYWLHDALEAAGFDSMVTPPSLVPRMGGRVKTDRRDSKKLATLLMNGFLRRVHILTPEERAHRQLVRTRNQIERNRKRTQAQIKSMLVFYGVRLTKGIRERWSNDYLQWVEQLRWDYPELKASMETLVKLYYYLDEQLKELTNKIMDLAETDKYRERVGLLIQIPGIGIYTAMSLLVELQDVERFRKSEQIASYLGLTPSQRSSGERIRMGSITHCGNPHLRTRFIESSWTLIRYDKNIRSTYERLKHQTGSGTKAIVGVARRLSTRVRRVLLDKSPYTLYDGGRGSISKGSRRFIIKK
jgi:transposase